MGELTQCIAATEIPSVYPRAIRSTRTEAAPQTLLERRVASVFVRYSVWIALIYTMISSRSAATHCSRRS